MAGMLRGARLRPEQPAKTHGKFVLMTTRTRTTNTQFAHARLRPEQPAVTQGKFGVMMTSTSNDNKCTVCACTSAARTTSQVWCDNNNNNNNKCAV
jgi:hypothetical protein